MLISTHTPVRVWLKGLRFYPSPICDFNSHTREGVTLQRHNHHQKYQISTHTPVRVWPKSLHSCWLLAKFQLTHPWGCDQVDCSLTAAAEYFNSHTREGVTTIIASNCAECNFNSHTREGVTIDDKSDMYKGYNFNSHTREGVTINCTNLDWFNTNFNSHTREGVTG